MKNAVMLDIAYIYIYIYTNVVFKNLSKHFLFPKINRESQKEPI